LICAARLLSQTTDALPNIVGCAQAESPAHSASVSSELRIMG